MTSSSVNAIVYYNDTITTTKHGSMFVSSSPMIVQLDNIMLLDAFKQAIGNKISLPNGKVVKDIIDFRLPVSSVGDYGQYRACTLHNDEDVMTMFSMFEQLSNLTCLKLYITTVDRPTQTCAHPPPIFASSLNLECLDEYLDEAMNHESSFQEIPPPLEFNWLLFYYLMICSCW